MQQLRIEPCNYSCRCVEVVCAMRVVLCCAVLCCAVLALGCILFAPKLSHCMRKTWAARLLLSISCLELLILGLCDAMVSMLALMLTRSRSVCHARLFDM